MSAFFALKTTLSAAMAKRSALLTRTKKALSRSRRAARPVPAVDACAAQQSPSVLKAADDEASSSAVTKATSDIVETTLHVFETTSNVAEATPKNTETTVNAPAIIFTPPTEEDAEWTWPHAEYEGVAAEDTPEDELPSHDTLLSLSFSWSLVPGIPRTSSYDQASLVSGASREIISATPGATTIPEVIVTSATASTIEADEAEATKEQAQTLPTGNDLIGLSKTSTITSLELGPVKSDGDAEKHTNEVTLVDHESDTAHAHTYVHGADLFTIVEADKPLESSTSEAKIPSTLRSFPSPFSRGNLSIKDIDALMSSGLETESSSMTPSFSASIDLGSDLFHGLLAIHASLLSVPALCSLASLETIPDEAEETLVQSSSSSASAIFAKLKQAVSPGDVDALLRLLVVGDHGASLVF